MRNYRGAAILLTIVLAVLLPGLAAGQQDGPRLQIAGVDADDFPSITLRLQALDGENRHIEDLQGLALYEDGQPVADFETRPLDIGVELFFVIDANSTIEDRDEAGGATRREKVRDSIIRYAERFMDPTQLDRVTIIVPEGIGGRFVDRPGMIFANEVINAINFYQPDEIDDVALNRLLFMALDEAARTADEGRYQSIVLFSDAANLADYPDMDAFASRAQEQGVTVHVVILGSRADTSEMDQARTLAEPTGGDIVHMPDPVDADALYEKLQGRGTLTEITYRSGIDGSGAHIISAELAGAQAETSVDLSVEPALVRLAVDNSRPILRVATDNETPLASIEPTQQPLVAQIDWPDQHRRAIESAALLVDGAEFPLDGSVLSDDGLLTFEWDISSLDSGIYPLQVQVVDELGLVGVSPPLPLTIEVQRPMAAADEAPTEVIAPTAAPAATAAPALDREQLTDNLVVTGAGIVLFVALLIILTVIVLLWRSRRQVPAAVPVQAPVPPPQAPVAAGLPAAGPPAAGPVAAQPEPGMTQIELPAFAVARNVGAYLEVLENAPEHASFIPLSGNNIVLGRDPRRVAISFKDRSVSRLHARILESHGDYRIYDEGSASGTYVNYERVSLAPRTLQDKDEIHFGRVHLRFHLASSLAAPPDPDREENTQIYGQP
jgi:hypothetical protein